jgi:hypothetical protein
VIGGIFGGLFLLLLICILVVVALRRKKHTLAKQDDSALSPLEIELAEMEMRVGSMRWLCGAVGRRWGGGLASRALTWACGGRASHVSHPSIEW